MRRRSRNCGLSPSLLNNRQLHRLQLSRLELLPRELTRYHLLRLHHPHAVHRLAVHPIEPDADDVHPRVPPRSPCPLRNLFPVAWLVRGVCEWRSGSSLRAGRRGEQRFRGVDVRDQHVEQIGTQRRENGLGVVRPCCDSWMDEDQVRAVTSRSFPRSAGDNRRLSVATFIHCDLDFLGVAVLLAPAGITLLVYVIGERVVDTLH